MGPGDFEMDLLELPWPDMIVIGVGIRMGGGTRLSPGVAGPVVRGETG